MSPEPLSQTLAVHWPYEENTHWTDEAIELLVGQECNVDFLGVARSGKILSAQRREDDDMVPPGLWVVIDVTQR